MIAADRLRHVARRLGHGGAEALLVVAYLLVYSLLIGGVGDSAYVVRQIAYHLREYGIATYNLGDVVYGFLSPLHIYAIAALGQVLPLMTGALFLSVLAWAGAAVLALRLLRGFYPERDHPLYWWVMMLLVAFEPVLVRQAALGSSESIAAFWALLALVLWQERRWPFLVGLALAGMMLTWLEAWLVAVMFIGAEFVRRPVRGVVVALTAAAPVVAWSVYTNGLYGQWWPTAPYADVFLYRNDTLPEIALRVGTVLKSVFGLNYSTSDWLGWLSGGLGFCLAVVGYFRLRRSTKAAGILATSVAGYVAYFAFVHTDTPVHALTLPRVFAFLLIAVALLELLEALLAKHARITLTMAQGGLILAWLAVFGVSVIHARAWLHYYELGMRADIGDFIREQALTDMETVLARDIGLLGFKTRLPMIDWSGSTNSLVEPALEFHTGSQAVRIIKMVEPTWLVLRDRDVMTILLSGYNLRKRYRFMREFNIPDTAPGFLKDNPTYVVYRRLGKGSDGRRTP